MAAFATARFRELAEAKRGFSANLYAFYTRGSYRNSLPRCYARIPTMRVIAFKESI